MAITEFPQQTTTQGLREFIGMINFYHRFIPHVADKLRPLYAATTTQQRELAWTDEQAAAFPGYKTRRTTHACSTRVTTSGVRVYPSGCSTPNTHTTIRWPLQGVRAERQNVCYRARRQTRHGLHRQAEASPFGPRPAGLHTGPQAPGSTSPDSVWRGLCGGAD